MIETERPQGEPTTGGAAGRTASSRRRGVEGAATRAELVEAAERLIREGGYAAVSARTLADAVGLKRQIVHYYFHSMDDVFIAVVRRCAERGLARLREALAAEEPLRRVWEFNSDPDAAVLMFELNALANRRPAVREEVKRLAEQTRTIQTEALVKHLQARGISPMIPPVVATVLISCASQVLALEKAIDIDMGHAETLALVNDCLRAFAEASRPPVDFAGWREAMETG